MEHAIVNVAIVVMTVVVPAHVVETSHVVTESVLYVARHYVVALRNSFLFYFAIFSVPTIRLEISINILTVALSLSQEIGSRVFFGE